MEILFLKIPYWNENERNWIILHSENLTKILAEKWKIDLEQLFNGKHHLKYKSSFPKSIVTWQSSFQNPSPFTNFPNIITQLSNNKVQSWWICYTHLKIKEFTTFALLNKFSPFWTKLLSPNIFWLGLSCFLSMISVDAKFPSS